jgi:putative Mn2+ efflux pump MntP
LAYSTLQVNILTRYGLACIKQQDSCTAHAVPGSVIMVHDQVPHTAPDFFVRWIIMGWLELILIALGLSMDAFAVALCKGMGMRRLNGRHAAVIALLFGGFQALMPLIGWLLGKQFESYITGVDHWIAFGLLAFIGGKMIYEGYKNDSCPGSGGDLLNIRELLLLAIATSLDALAVGITLAFLQVSILSSVSLIGMITCMLSFAGVCIGHKFGTKLKSKAELLGGAVLILIGLRILLEHLELLP